MLTARRIFALITFTALAFALAGCNGGVSRSTTLSTPGGNAQPGEPVEITLPSTRCRGLFMVDATINGFGPYPMIVDTGASTTSLSPRVREEANVRGRIDTLAIGGFETTNCRKQVHDLAHLANALGTELEGIVGHDVFDGTTVTYDYGASELRVANTPITRDSAHVVPTKKNSSRPFVRAGIDYDDDGEPDGRFWLLIDTGSSGALSVRPFDDLRFAGADAPTGAVMKIDGLHVTRGGRLDGDVAFGPVRMVSPVIESSPSSNLLGYEVLENFVVSFDKARDLARFVPITDELHTSEPARGIGVALNRNDEGYAFIAKVFDGSPAKDAGLRKGDVIRTVNGEPTNRNLCEPYESPFDEIDLVTLVIDREGEILDVDVEVVTLVP